MIAPRTSHLPAPKAREVYEEWLELLAVPAVTATVLVALRNLTRGADSL